MIYTIGHTLQSVDEFYNMITKYDINCIIDVRSMPYSQHAPQFNKENLNVFLRNNGVLYAHFGVEFGARRYDCLSSVKKDGQNCMQVNFGLGVKTDNFKRGIHRLNNALAQNRTVALMCTEADPLDCHRFSFISRYLYDNGYDIAHIMRNKTTNEVYLKSHQELESSMIAEYIKKKKLSETGGLFNDYSLEQQRIDAYILKNHEIGYIPNNSTEEEQIID